MSGPKRKELSTDELMRRQEEPLRKRRKQISKELDARSEDEGSTSTEDMEGSDAVEDDSALEEEDREQDDRVDGQGDLKNASTFWDITDEPGSSRMKAKLKSLARDLTPSKTNAPKFSTFSSLDISTTLIATLAKMSIRAPTEVQTACVPPLLAGEFTFGLQS